MGVPAAITDAARQKQLGAFYTPPAMAAALVGWAVRSPEDRVLDPSFGGLVFLRAAEDRLVELGKTPEELSTQIHGIEVDAEAHRKAMEAGPRGGHNGLVLGDFFSIQPERDVPLCDAVVGNPPYVRYQDFKRSSAAAHRVAEAAGVRLTRLASSWAPFLVHAASFVSNAGRMAQVLPAELMHAQYASEVLDFIRRRFRRVTIVVFEERVFPGALEEVVLLLADDRGEGHSADIELRSARTLDDLDVGSIGSRFDPPARPQLSRAASREKLLVQLLPTATQDLYRSLADSESVNRLGTLADVDIGAVTGGNDFFVLSDHEAAEVDADLLRPCVSKAAQVRGARYTDEDHRALVSSGRKASIFIADEATPHRLLDSARSYLSRGERAGIHKRYKCRTREPWWAVPMPKIGTPDLLLTYCANKHPRLALNEAGVVQTNTIHGVALSDPDLGPALAATFYNSLTLLSAELVGRSYGGGVLKLEPTEAEALLVPPLTPEASRELPRIDELVRAGDVEALLTHVDRLVLNQGFGLSEESTATLRSASARLRARRQARGKPVSRGSGHVR
jgi:adenine-specific DNA-methyltransferase